jgi:hypothetical protein
MTTASIDDIVLQTFRAKPIDYVELMFPNPDKPEPKGEIQKYFYPRILIILKEIEKISTKLSNLNKYRLSHNSKFSIKTIFALIRRVFDQ